MSALLWRVIIAVVCYVLFVAILPPVLAVLAVNVDANVVSIIRICAAGIALLYILKGPPFPA